MLLDKSSIHCFHKYIKQHNCFNIFIIIIICVIINNDNNKNQTSLLEWFVKDRLTLNINVSADIQRKIW